MSEGGDGLVQADPSPPADGGATGAPLPVADNGNGGGPVSGMEDLRMVQLYNMDTLWLAQGKARTASCSLAEFIARTALQASGNSSTRQT